MPFVETTKLLLAVNECCEWLLATLLRTSLTLIIEFLSHLAAKSDKHRRRLSPLHLDEEREALARSRGPNVCMVRTSPKI